MGIYDTISSVKLQKRPSADQKMASEVILGCTECACGVGDGVAMYGVCLWSG